MLLPKSNAWLVSFLMVSNRPTRCSEPLSFKVGGASKPFAILCGMGPLGNSSLQLIVYSYFCTNLLITCRFFVIFLVVSRKKRNFGCKS